MNKSTIQVPIDNNLRINAENMANSLGYSSLQEVLRVFTTQLANKTISINLVNKTPDEILTEKQETVLIKKLEQFKKGKVFTAHSAEEMFNQLGI
jgi:antitoxin component of RelBE/YafQ-DinJ toxin-antitoxin module